MRPSLLHLAVAIPAVIVASSWALGCSAPRGEDAVSSGNSAGALVALTSNEIVGTIAYGQTTLPFNYTGNPRYQALQFTGQTGDAVNAFVRSTNGHARAWLLAADFSNIAYSVSDGTQTDAQVTATLPSAGTYYIAWRDYFLENASFLVQLTGTPLMPPPPPPPPDAAACDPEVSNCGDGGLAVGNLVKGSDRSFVVTAGSNNAILQTWGKGLWDGYISFSAVLTGVPQDDQGAFTDGTGAVYPVPSGTPTHFDRLPLPLTLRGTSEFSFQSTITMTLITFEVTAVHPIPAQSLTGLFSGVGATNVTVVGADIPGVTMQFSAAATFFDNFTDGNACAQLTLNGQSLTPAKAAGSFTVTAPLTINSQAVCISSRLATQQNAAADFSIGLSNIILGNPQ
jgi:hypothetical protein